MWYSFRRKKFLSEEEYNKAKVESTRLVNEGKENELIDFSVMANGKIAAGTYYNDFYQVEKMILLDTQKI